MKKYGWTFAAALFLIVLILLPESIHAEEIDLQVFVQKANVRAKHDLRSVIVTQVSLGTVLKSDMKEGNWFRILFSPDEKGVTRKAYIHTSEVEVMSKLEEAARLLKKTGGMEIGLRLFAGGGYLLGTNHINDAYTGITDFYHDINAGTGRDQQLWYGEQESYWTTPSGMLDYTLTTINLLNGQEMWSQPKFHSFSFDLLLNLSSISESSTGGGKMEPSRI